MTKLKLHFRRMSIVFSYLFRMHGISLNLLSFLPQKQNLIQNDHVMSRTWGLIVNMFKRVILFSLSHSSHITSTPPNPVLTGRCRHRSCMTVGTCCLHVRRKMFSAGATMTWSEQRARSARTARTRIEQEELLARAARSACSRSPAAGG